ncbi:GNAT family N-acetyltransferase [Paenibacillus sp. G2S3]|uniref:GNAT family N-acetyltransferase n=1 Tax=Paenibacillus sp. G2S3 TaxID=3047872 RepID=UPI0024C0F5B3|nr:GNAT family N-acetyltransferase [Paenibacillus sp. G2S3]WHY16976.1 GNAT family N-acetyltransferase [Paenibacillus sp. G2S3]
MMVTFKVLISEDAEELLRLQHQLDQESKFMLMEPDERQSSLNQVREMIESFASADTSILIGAEVDSHLIGFMSVRGGSVRRNRHSAYIVIGILRQYQSQGIGTGLFKELDAWARNTEIVRLELTVMTHNELAMSLYIKNGFEIEGTKRKSLLIDGQWVDEYYMSKILIKENRIENQI